MYKKRNDLMPKNPTNADEIKKAYENAYVKTHYGLTIRALPDIEKQSMFFKTAQECSEYAYCIFSSDEIVKEIKENTDPNQRKLFTDGTFKICPKGIFNQVLILYTLLFGQVKLRNIYNKFS